MIPPLNNNIKPATPIAAIVAGIAITIHHPCIIYIVILILKNFFILIATRHAATKAIPHSIPNIAHAKAGLKDRMPHKRIGV